MELPDFSSDAGLERLRREIGATEIVELRAPAWRDWDGFGIDIADISEVQVEPDGTLSYEDRRVLVYIRDRNIDRYALEGFRYHVAECETLKGMRRNQRFSRYVVTTRTDGRFVVNLFSNGEQEERLLEIPVCKNCLKSLDWKSYKGLSWNEKEACWKAFDPNEFLDKYGSRVKGLPTQTPESAILNQYPQDWSEISRRTRERAHWTCERCRLVFTEPLTRRWLHVHHRDGNKANSTPSNLEALCLGCHQQEFGHDHLKHGSTWNAFKQWRRKQH